MVCAFVGLLLYCRIKLSTYLIALDAMEGKPTEGDTKRGGGILSHPVEMVDLSQKPLSLLR